MLTETDHLAVTELYGRYAHAFDGARARECAELFSTDGTFTVHGRSPINGRAALEEFFVKAAQSPGSQHFVSNIVLDVVGPDRVDGSAYVVVLRVNEDSVRLASVGSYRDEFVRANGNWLIRSRYFRPVLPEALAGAALVSSGS